MRCFVEVLFMTQVSKTFVLIKPDSIEKGIVSLIVERFIKSGFIVEKMDCVYAQSGQIEKMYADNISINGEEYVIAIKNYLVGNIVIPIQFTFIGDENAIDKARKLIGYFDPLNAEKGSIRFDYGSDSLNQAMKEHRCCYNMIHAASDYEEYILDMGIWFESKEKNV